VAAFGWMLWRLREVLASNPMDNDAKASAASLLSLEE
jgi:hypothetical protein